MTGSWVEGAAGAGEGYPYVILDAHCESVRQNGRLDDAAILIAPAIDLAGRREILGVSGPLPEHEPHWKAFLKSLLERGLCGVELIVSDDHRRLRDARQAVFGSIPWQRCQFQMQQNAGAYVPRREMRAEAATAVRAIFTAPDWQEEESLLKRAVDLYAKSAPKPAEWMDENVVEGLAVFSFPAENRCYLRTINGLERVNHEIRSRTRVARMLPNEASCLRLLSAVLMEFSEEW